MGLAIGQFQHITHSRRPQIDAVHVLCQFLR
jgi:hypothetical protein